MSMKAFDLHNKSNNYFELIGFNSLNKFVGT